MSERATRHRVCHAGQTCPGCCQRRPAVRPSRLSRPSTERRSASCSPAHCDASRAERRRKRNRPANSALICSREAVGADSIWVRRAATPPPIARRCVLQRLQHGAVMAMPFAWALTVRAASRFCANRPAPVLLRKALKQSRVNGGHVASLRWPCGRLAGAPVRPRRSLQRPAGRAASPSRAWSQLGPAGSVASPAARVLRAASRERCFSGAPLVAAGQGSAGRPGRHGRHQRPSRASSAGYERRVTTRGRPSWTNLPRRAGAGRPSGPLRPAVPISRPPRSGAAGPGRAGPRAEEAR